MIENITFAIVCVGVLVLAGLLIMRERRNK